ncbi:putative glutamine/gamma-aminobutyrate antiporter GadC [Providencia sneebia]|uniref:Amino acid permease n=1 Tax=Providencia sneebia DSM 19967 TaxID=1141660 RepID=K8WK42_9GAMM|nr:putative glutamine/gamma-aminobutyrate antiporter GadC [Providencia sneebia]EKT60978.1 amino acid permease [Providencia sneebia DSM 19967]
MTDSVNSSQKATISASDNKKASAGTISIFGLVLLNITAVVSLNGLPSEAEYGLSSIFYYLLAAILFLVPVALIAAELATGWPEKGGMFRWIGEAFGGRFAFTIMMILFVEVCVFLPTALTFGAVSIAYIDPNENTASSLASNKIFILVLVLAVYWVATFIGLRGSKAFATMAKYGGVIGVFIPAGLLIILGFAYVISGNTPEVTMAWGDIIPDFSNFSNVVLAASIFLMYAGMEMNAVHVKEVKNPTRNYPIAIMSAAIGTVLILVLATLAIAFVVPNKQINLTQAILTAYHDLFVWVGIPWASSIVAIMLAIGVLTCVTTWVVGPSTGVLAVAKAGYLPKIWQKTNKNGSATFILLLQAVLVTCLSILFVVLPSVQAAYQILNQLANILYLTAYICMFAAALRLRYSQPNRPRPYTLPGGNLGMWIVGGIGFISALTAFIFSFIPPDQISVGSPEIYFGVLVILTLIFWLFPSIIYAVRKPSWKGDDPDFAPFTWETQANKSINAPKSPTE